MGFKKPINFQVEVQETSYCLPIENFQKEESDMSKSKKIQTYQKSVMDILKKIGGFFTDFGIHVNKKVKQKKYSSHFREK